MIRALILLLALTPLGVSQIRQMSQSPVVRGRAAAAGVRPFVEEDASGRARFAAGVLSGVLPGSPEDAAVAFAAGELRVPSDALRISAATEWNQLRYVRMDQFLDGVPVEGGEVVVTLDAANCVVQFARGEWLVRQTLGGWQIDEAAARAKAPAGEGTAERVWHPAADGLIPAYRLLLTVEHPLSAWEYLIDARDGRVIRARNLTRRADANVFPQNPVRDRGQFERVALPNLNSKDFLDGRFAKIFSSVPALRGQVAQNTVVQLAQSDAQGHFLYSPEDVRFSEAQLYWAIDRAHARFAAMGFNRLDRPVEGVVYFPEAFKVGPFFLSTAFNGRGGIFFAPSGPRDLDLTWDTDVIYHEYTHAVVNAVVGDGQSLEFGALNEGWGDYFSNSFQNDPNIGEFGVEAFLPGLPYLRTSANSARYPRDYVTEVHTGSLIWSGALWDLRNALGPDRADRIALGALLGLRGDAGYFAAAVSAATAARVLYGETVSDQVIGIMAARGILTLEGLSAFAAEDLGDEQPRENTIDAAGTGSAACLLDDARQFKIEVPANGARLNLSFVSQADAILFIRYRRPVTIENGRAMADYQTDRGTQVQGSVTTGSTPELQAGLYYIAVANCSPAQQRYRIVASVTLLGDRVPLPFTVLTSGMAESGSTPPGPLMNARQFAIQVPQGATTLSLLLDGSVNVDLYASFGQPVQPTDIGVPVSDAFAVTAANRETLTISTLTKPALRPGTYFFSVFNRDETQLARFTITATVSAGAATGTRVTQVAADGNARATLPAAAPGRGILGAEQFSFVAPAGARRVTVSASSAADAYVFVRARNAIEVRDGEPVFDYVLSTARRPRIDITPSGFPALAPGATYFLAVANFSTSPADVAIRVEFDATGGGGGGAGPAVTTGGVVNGASFRSLISSGSWVTIQGSNLASTTRIWQGSDFSGNRLPTVLDGVSVTINGRSAYVYFISPTQLNVLAPDDTGEGTVEVRVRNGAGEFVTQTQRRRVAPALFVFDPAGRRYAAAVHNDGAFVGPPGLFPGANVRTVAGGDAIAFFGTGFGDVEGSANSGVVRTQAARLLAGVSARIGGRAARVTFAGLVLNGLYQINVVAPEGLAGDLEVELEVDGVRTQTGVFITMR